MSNIPADLKYTKSHEWVRTLANGSVEVGITDHAQGALGDLVFVEVPAAGKALKAGDTFAVVESVKAASDVYAPVAGAVVEGNASLGQPARTHQFRAVRRRLDHASQAGRRARRSAERRRIRSAPGGGGLTMPFNPHTPKDVGDMLAAIGAKTIDELFDEIPKELRIESLAGIPDALNEMNTGKLMSARAAQDGTPLNFIGAGAYEHHIPAAVWAVTTRGEFYSAYTPYQAEASQGTLQLIYEYQTMISSLTGMQVSNASLYDGGSAVAEARSWRSVRIARRSRNASWSRRLCILTTARSRPPRPTGQGVRFEEVPCPKGYLSVADLAKYRGRRHHRHRHPAAEFLRRARRRGCDHRLGACQWHFRDRLGQSDITRDSQAAG